MSGFGFDVGDVFGDSGFGSARKGRKKGKKKNIGDGFDCLNCDDQGFSGGLGIDTFSLKSPSVNALEIGGDFGSQIGSRAGKANGKHGGFLDVIGNQQVRVPSVIGTRVGGKGKGKGRGRKVGRPRGSGVVRQQQSPLQRVSGTTFGSIDDRFSSNVIGNVRGAKRRISEFRARRRKSKTESTQERPALPPPKPEQLRQPERPALPAPKASSLGAVPRETNVQAIGRLTREDDSRSAT